MKSNILLILALVVSSSMFASSTSHAANKIKSHHKDAGLSCKDCHTTKPFDEVEMDQCLTCHELPEKRMIIMVHLINTIHHITVQNLVV